MLVFVTPPAPPWDGWFLFEHIMTETGTSENLHVRSCYNPDTSMLCFNTDLEQVAIETAIGTYSHPVDTTKDVTHVAQMSKPDNHDNGNGD